MLGGGRSGCEGSGVGGGGSVQRDRATAAQALMDCRFRNEVITLAAIIANPFEYGNASISWRALAHALAFLFPSPAPPQSAWPPLVLSRGGGGRPRV